MAEFRFIKLEEKSSDWFHNQEKQHLYLSKNWLSSLAKTYNFEVLLVVDENDNYQTAFCKLNDMMGKRITSLPFSDYIPYSKNNSNYFETLFKSCSSKFPNYNIILKTNQDKHILQNPYKLTKEAVYHSINISGELPKQSSSFKRGVKQAKKNEVTVRINNSVESLKTFYQLYHRLRFDKFNIIPQPFLFFENLRETMISQGQGNIFEAVYKDKVIASMIVFHTNKSVFYKFGCSDIEHLQLKPNNLLFYELIQHYKKLSYHNIDLGLSGIGDSYAGLRRWKKGLGGTEYPITNWIYSPHEECNEHDHIQKNKTFVKNLTDSIVKANLDTQQTSLLSEQIYHLLA